MQKVNRHIVRKSTLAEQGREDDLRDTTVEVRLKMMWPLAVDAWAMKGEDFAERKFQRHIERIIRGRG